MARLEFLTRFRYWLVSGGMMTRSAWGRTTSRSPVSYTHLDVYKRQVLRCAGNQSVPGFGYINPDTNEFEGFDIDFCKAVAAAVLGDANAIEVRPTTANERFPVLQACLLYTSVSSRLTCGAIIT